MFESFSITFVILLAYGLLPLALYNLIRGLLAPRGLPDEPNPRRAFLRRAQWMFLIWLVAAGSMVVKVWTTTAPAQARLTACECNLKNLATCCEMYASDCGGRYPPNLNVLTPTYLKVLPRCPSLESNYAGSQADLHAAYGYVRSAYAPDLAGSVDAYTLFCSDSHHTEVGIKAPNYPQYSSYSGLLVP